MDRIILLEAVGRLTLTEGQTKIRDLIHVFTGNGAKRFILNLAQVEFIDSCGVGELARCYSVVRQLGGEVKLVGVSGKVLDVLEICRLHKLFEIYSGDGAALEAFGQHA